MGVDFSSLVLAPAMEVFGNLVTVTPLHSQPNAPAYLARGVWKVDDIDIILENGGRLSDHTIKLGIRLRDFIIVPQQGDLIATLASLLPLAYSEADADPNYQAVFVVDDQDTDGQGGGYLVLKRVIA